MADGSKCGSLAEFVARHMGGKLPAKKPQRFRDVKPKKPEVRA